MPEHPRLHGIYYSANRRFEWNFDKIPSPQRSSWHPHLTEHVPIRCDNCGAPYWPPAAVMTGFCSEMCERLAGEEKKATEEEMIHRRIKDLEAELDAMRQQQGRVSVS